MFLKTGDTPIIPISSVFHPKMAEGRGRRIDPKSRSRKTNHGSDYCNGHNPDVSIRLNRPSF